jgi:predicted PurR-regulated permease PerM
MVNEWSDILTEFFTDPTVKEILIQLLSTLIGALVGFVLAMALNRHEEKRQTRKTRDQVIDSIVEELSQTQNGLKNLSTNFDIRWDKTEKRFIGTFGLASRSAFESVVNSGNFTLLSASLQTRVSETYQRIELFNSDIMQIQTFYMTSVYQSESAEDEATNLVSRLNETIQKLQKDIGELIPKLQTAKKYAIYLDIH